MNAPLAGIRVVEIASFVAAPAAGALLCDLGAEVVKVEVPGGELYRHSVPRMLGVRSEFPEAPHFQMDNRGKRSLVLDLTREQSRRALERVIDRCDIVLTNLLPQRQTKYGLDAETLRASRPELIHASMSGYGPDGADATMPAFDYTAYWARTGFMDKMRDRDSPPAFLRPGVGDHAAALALVSGILAALRLRDQTGEGQTVDVNLLHIGLYVQGNDAAVAAAVGSAPPNHDRNKPRNPLWNHYQTGDDRWIFLVMIESGRYWPRLCVALGLEALEDDERFRDPVSRYRNSEELTGILAREIAARSLAECRDLLNAHDLIWAPVQTIEEALQDPQVQSAGVLQTMQHPTAGEFTSIAPPIRLSAFDLRSDRAAPELGADNQQVLVEAGLSEDEIREALGTQE